MLYILEIMGLQVQVMGSFVFFLNSLIFFFFLFVGDDGTLGERKWLGKINSTLEKWEPFPFPSLLS